MSIWTTIKEWCVKPATSQTVQWIDAGHVKPAFSEVPIKAEETYLRISVVEMVLSRSRDWFKDYQPTVQALTRLKFGNQTIELPSIAAADSSKYAPDHSVLSNFTLLSLVPFRGGSVELAAALIALPGDDRLANGIKALSNVAGLIGAPLSTALAIAGRVKESVEMLAGSGGLVHLAYQNTLTAQLGANQLRAGYLAVVAADPGFLTGRSLVVENDQLRLWDGALLYPLGQDSLLLRIEILPNRDDMRAFSDLEKLRATALQAFVKDGDEAGDRAFREAAAAIIVHPELINADRRTLITELKTDCDAYRGGAHGAGPGAPIRSWAELAEELPKGNDHAAVSLSEFV